MPHYPEAVFIKSANALQQFVPDEGGEVAFAGRSNAGKSSAINTIVNRKQFARTSKTPGRTQLVNFFRLAGDTRIVDLPGYGFARVSDKMKRHWAGLLADYFRQRASLRGLVLIVDIRRQLTDFDWRMIEFAEEVALPIHVVLTKADKLKRGQVASAVLAVRKQLEGRATVQAFSALKRTGADEARRTLESFLGLDEPGAEAGASVE